MPQYNNYLPALNAAGQPKALTVDAQGSLIVGGGVSATYNITAATVVKSSPGRLMKVTVQVGGSAAGTVNNCTTTGAAAIGNQIGVIPTTGNILDYSWPCSAGITIVPGTGQTVAVSYI